MGAEERKPFVDAHLDWIWGERINPKAKKELSFGGAEFPKTSTIKRMPSSIKEAVDNIIAQCSQEEAHEEEVECDDNEMDSGTESAKKEASEVPGGERMKTDISKLKELSDTSITSHSGACKQAIINYFNSQIAPTPKTNNNKKIDILQDITFKQHVYQLLADRQGNMDQTTHESICDYIRSANMDNAHKNKLMKLYPIWGKAIAGLNATYKLNLATYQQPADFSKAANTAIAVINIDHLQQVNSNSQFQLSGLARRVKTCEDKITSLLAVQIELETKLSNKILEAPQQTGPSNATVMAKLDAVLLELGSITADATLAAQSLQTYKVHTATLFSKRLAEIYSSK